MTITLSPETQKMLEHRMQVNGFVNADDAIHAALVAMTESPDQVDDRSPETLAAIQRGLAQAEAGLSRSWGEFEKELIARNATRQALR